MHVIDTFSGIGGFSLGLERAGFETVAFVEIDDYCRAVLKKHWPDVPQYRDIRDVTGEQLRADGITADVITGGFPCQPASQIGLRKGVEDDRWLWPELFRLIKEVRPTWFIGENVVGLIDMGLDTVLADLVSIGYACGSYDIPAASVGANHERRRIFILAHADRQRLEGLSSPSNAPGSKTGGYDRTSHRWMPAPRVCRGSDGIPNRVDRLKCLGNAVVPQIPEIIGRAIMSCNIDFSRHQTGDDHA